VVGFLFGDRAIPGAWAGILSTAGGRASRATGRDLGSIPWPVGTVGRRGVAAIGKSMGSEEEMSSHDLSDFAPKGKPAVGGSTRLLRVASGLAWGLVLALLVFGVPKVRGIYADFGLDLPRASVLVLQATDWLTAHAPTLLVLLGTAWIVREILSGGEGARNRGWWVGMVVVPLLLLALMVVALGVPLSSLAHRLRD